MNFITEILVLIGIGFIAGIINTLAGGGSLLTLPILIFLGLPPNIANGTNRIAIFIQNIFTTAGFRSKGVKTFPFSIYLGISALIGAILGAQLAVDIRGELFNRILSVIMLMAVLYMVFQKKTKNILSQEKVNGKYFWISVMLFFFVGVYGGFIQAGVGFIMIFILNGFNRMSLVKSNAVKVTVALIYTISALIIFALNDKINWQMGFELAIGNAAGGWFASRIAVKKGDNFVKKILIISVIILAIKLWFY
ncbi:MAG: sulfite exporter TauE/SafE family protein [Lutibacter sp.]